MDKKIELSNGNVMLVNTSPGYCCDIFSIKEGCLKNGELLSSLELSIWDDIAFNAYTVDNKCNNIEFIIDINHPLYFCIKQLLADEGELIIDDDDTFNKLEKYLVIKKEANIYKFIFINNSKEDCYKYNRFRVFIKNIGSDPRSKITNNSTKLRIVKFFRDAQERLFEDEHQINIDEYIETLNQINKR